MAATAEVVLELIPDTSKVTTALDELQTGGKVSDNSAAAYKDGNKELQKRAALLTDVNTAEKKNIATLKDVQANVSKVAGAVIQLSGKDFQKAWKDSGKSFEDFTKSLVKGDQPIKSTVKNINGLTLAAKDTSKTVSGVLVNSTSQYTAVLTKNSKDVDDNTKKTKSLKAEKRELAEQIARLIDAGQKETEMYDKLIKRAGQIDDAIKDANDAISRTGSDTRGLDTTIQVAQGVAAGFSVATSAAALFGTESEDVQKTLLKVNAAMALLNGLQEIQNLLKSEYLLSLSTQITRQLFLNAQLAIESGLQSKSIILRGLATAAQWLLNAAMAANPVGLLVIGIAALISVLYIFSKSSDDAAAAQKRLADAEAAVTDAAIEQAKIIQAAADKYIKKKERELTLLKASGASNDVIFKKEKALADLRQQAAAAQAGFFGVEIANLDQIGFKLDELRAKRTALVNQTGDDAQKERDSIDKTIETLQKQFDAGTKASDDYSDAIIANQALVAEKQKADRELSLASAKAAIDAQISLAKAGSQEELKLKEQAAIAQRNIDLNDVNLTESQKRAVIATSIRTIRELRQAAGLLSLEDEKATIEARSYASKVGSKDEFDYKIALLKIQSQIELNNASLTANQRKAIEAKTLREISDLTKQFNDQQVINAGTVELLKAQIKVASFREGTIAYEAANKVALKAQASLDIIGVQQSTESEELKSNKILLIRANLNKQLDDITRSRNEKDLQDQRNFTASLNALANQRAGNKASNVNNSQFKAFQLGQDALTLQLKQSEDARTTIHQDMLNGLYKSDLEYQDALTNNTAQSEALRFQIQQNYASRQKELLKATAAAAIDIAKQTTDAIFSNDKAQRDANLQQKIDALNTEKDVALGNKNITEKEKAALQKKYDAKEKELKRDAAREQRRADIQKAIAEGILAAVVSFQNAGGFPFGLIAAALSLATTGIYIAQLKATPLGYAKGTKNAKKGWRWVGEEGPELMNFEGGETVKTHKESVKMAANWEKENIAASIPKNHSKFFSAYSVDKNGNMEIDYDRLGKAINENSKEPVIIDNNFDENGYHSYMTSRNSKREYKNKRYKVQIR